MSKELTKSSSSDPSQRAAAAATAAPPSPPRKSPPKAVPPAAEKTPRKRPAPKPSTPVEPVRNQITSGTLRINKHILQLARPHLSKITGDLKQKCTQLLTPFLGTVFHALSLGVIHFIRSVRSRNHFFIG